MKLLNFLIIKLSICLIIGILFGYYIELSFSKTIIVSAAFLIIYSIGMLLAKRRLKQPIWVGVVLLLTMMSLGVLTIKLHEQRNFKNHYSKYKLIEKDTTSIIQFRIREVLKPGNYYNKYVIDILKINTVTVTGKSLLNIEKDTINKKLQVDDILVSKTQFKDLMSPLNPHQFDYKSYLKKKHIYHQLFNTSNNLLKVDSIKHTLFGYAASIREKVNQNLKPYNFKDDELTIINALLLGQRQDISKEIYNSYTQAGAIHILAVSGLHVGIILLLLNYLFKPIEYFKYGKLFKTFLLVTILWSFAIIAGLSASVVRAVTMFTVIAIAMNWKRPTNVYNTLAISMFVLLLFNPNFLFDVGFQLSYLAVLAIVIIQPIIYSLYNPKFKLDKLLWNVLTVTVAAQFGVIPISLYYFHQFPGLFFVSNLVIIPFLGLILGCGIIIIALSLLNILPHFIASFYGEIISIMNRFVTWISLQEGFLFKNISFSKNEVLLSYILITTVIIFIKLRTYKSIVSVLAAIVLIQGYFVYDKYNASQDEFIVFHKSRYSILGFKQNDQLTLHHNITQIDDEKLITNYKVGENVNITYTDSIENVYVFNKKKLLVIDSLSTYKVKTFKADIILLRNSPKINLVRLIDSLKPEIIISDGSNFKSYQERWAQSSSAKKIPFHQTSKKGAFIYNY